ISVIIPAAGSGRRLGKDKNKILLDFLGKPVLGYSLDLFSRESQVAEIIIAAAQGEEVLCDAIAQKYCGETPFKVVTGGAERMDSVWHALERVSPAADYVMVHDGARPFLDKATLRRLLTAEFTDGAILALPVKETVKAVSAAGDSKMIISTVPRQNLYHAQTPQLFRKEALMDAYKKGIAESFTATDDASLAENLGYHIRIVEGCEDNVKITTPHDWETSLLKESRKMIRIGSGYDVHILGPDRPLILGGVAIPFERGLVGHSDADVAVHALMDALLGAMAMGDIGQHFPPSDDAYLNADSIELLKHVFEMMEREHFHLVNADLTIMAERPKMAPHIKEMRENIAAALQADISQISVKATTTEKLGFVGREEGIAASAVVLLEQLDSERN
ncbi:MAG: 2-C-methyl-D-erythritol 2,4-cyclodiphosphate synthase, partial [Bacillota bacterium]|nr:2-C-methyl-D-erythritol 2,4-cyclodiphosphate synthase [Bacillota bacterium]